MSAITPKASNHAQLPPLASRFVDVDALPWEPTRFPGIETKVLLMDRASGVATALMKFAPGARLPDHGHVLIEQTWVIEGSLVCGEGECRAGEFVWRPAGSRHEAWGGPQGGLMLAMFQIPNKFFERDGRETDVLGQDWYGAWGGAAARAGLKNEASVSPPRRKTVVIAEDDGATRAILRLILKQGDYDVIGEASDGESAVGLCAEHMPDIACLDVMMPKLDGIGALKAIKTWNPDTVVLMITMDAAAATVSEALQNGAAGYVIKPFNSGKILDTLAHALNKPPG